MKQGGFKEGELSCLMAKSNCGKSMLAIKPNPRQCDVKPLTGLSDGIHPIYKPTEEILKERVEMMEEPKDYSEESHGIMPKEERMIEYNFVKDFYQKLIYAAVFLSGVIIGVIIG